MGVGRQHGERTPSQADSQTMGRNLRQAEEGGNSNQMEESREKNKEI